MNFQALIDGISAQMMDARAESQMTLGDLIECIGKLPAGQMIDGLHSPHSYRGYYSDLAFESGDKRTVQETMQMLRDCMGKQFTGWKGGEYHMHAGTPCWVACEGCCGQKIAAIDSAGVLALEDDE